MTIISALLICPLTYVKSIEKLRHAALFAIASIALFAIATFVTMVDEIKYNDHEHDGAHFGIPPTFSLVECIANLPKLMLSFGYIYYYMFKLKIIFIYK